VTKTCRICNIEKSLEDDFYRTNRSWCKPCLREYNKEYRKRRPFDVNAYLKKLTADEYSAVRRKGNLGTWYRLTPERYAEMLAAQGGGCAVCGTSMEIGGKTSRSMAVDHDHTCCPGRKSCGSCIRGILCGNCNRGLGQFNDDPDRLEKAVAYLRNARSMD
jgi:recombination endonuclease VII